MKKRTKLRDRILPDYYKGEEIMNMVTHIVGGALGIVALLLCTIRAALHGLGAVGILSAIVFGLSMITLYTMSSVYHGLRPGTGKKVLQIIDHCTIYLLIAGSYTPPLLVSLVPVAPVPAWCLFGIQWGLAILAITLNAIDLDKYTVFSMICYIGLGWSIIFFAPLLYRVMHPAGFWLLLTGGIAYTIGAVLYGIGSKVHWMHSIFHIFVVIGSLLHLLAFGIYIL